MTTALPFPAKETAQRFHASLTSMMQFDEIEIRGVIGTIINPSDRESCFLLIYHRTAANVASLSKLNGQQHFQAITMLARNLFELSVDIKLIDKIIDSVPKMIAHVEVEKLRAAKKIVAYKKRYPAIALDDSLYQSYIASEGSRIEANKAKLWPGARRIDGWPNMNLKDRSELLGHPYDETYEVEQPRMSWQVHSGLTGVANLKAETFTHMAGVGIGSCIKSYETILSAVIDEFKIDKADDKIKGKLEVSKLLPFADDDKEARALFREATA
ncbi:MAG: hypothetical protein ACLPY1_23220 [Terracidiphilus sp.]